MDGPVQATGTASQPLDPRFSTAAKIEESPNLSPRTPNTLICAGIWFYPKLNSLFSLANTRTTP